MLGVPFTPYVVVRRSTVDHLNDLSFGLGLQNLEYENMLEEMRLVNKLLNERIEKLEVSDD